ncbi:MAG: carboxypeptidase-like regulatory domain-containing protein, partial [Flavobacteriales bacterium]|nr:carboxypeptidase-like regulatory domain-containing protein [Flavobacteriales bacterium]
MLAQKTKVSGKVVDSVTGEPLPFVNILFVGTKSGTTTDFDGYYELETYYASDSLRASCLGYVSQTKGVKLDVAQQINFQLAESSIQLEEATIRPDETENPAHPIVRGILRNKDINNREKLEAYEYELYNKVEFDLNNLSDEFMERKIFKPFDFVFDNLDSTEEKVFLPIFMTENISNFYYRKDPKTEKEIIQAARVSGIENNSVNQFLGDMYQNVNIYDNNIIVFGKSFVSPISSSGFAFYKYYLEDSTLIGDKWCYQIKFLPKRKQELTFTGDFWVNDTTYAIKRVDATIAEDANINWIQGLNVQQEYDEVQNEVWMLTNDQLVIDFNIADKTMGFYGRKTTSYQDFVINQPRKDEFYKGVSDIIVDQDANEKSAEFWDVHRHVELTDNEKAVYQMV